MTHQPAILAPCPPLARFLTFRLLPDHDPKAALHRVRNASFDARTVIGLGAPLVSAAGGGVAKLRPFPAVNGPGVSFPATQGALWAALGGDDAGVLLHRARKLAELLGDALRLDEDVLAFQHGGGRDLSGFEDGTENPTGEKAVAAAIAGDGSSFVAVQRWVHDLARFDRLTPEERDHAVGRSLATNEELAEAPRSAHVKRAAQESYDPPAFMVRRSMPYGSVGCHGLYFVAYGASFDAFERVLVRMAGAEDGVVDGLLRFTRALTGGYYWCPPHEGGQLDLGAIGI